MPFFATVHLSQLGGTVFKHLDNKRRGRGCPGKRGRGCPGRRNRLHYPGWRCGLLGFRTKQSLHCRVESVSIQPTLLSAACMSHSQSINICLKNAIQVLPAFVSLILVSRLISLQICCVLTEVQNRKRT
jgi:hypothetical protein